MIQWNTPYGYDRSQAEFDRQVGIFALIVNIFIKILVFAPLLGVGYLIAGKFVAADASVWKWLLWIAVIAFIQFSIIQGVKLWMQHLRSIGNPLWMILFLFLVAYCCGVNLLIVYQPFLSLIRVLFHGWHTKTLVWVLLGFYGLFVYRQYRFFEPVA